MEDTHIPPKRRQRQENLRLRTAKAGSRRALTAHVQNAEPSPENRILLESVFRVAPIGIGVVRDHVLVEVNDRLCTMTGYRAEELMGQSTRMLYPTQEDYDYVGREKYSQIARTGMATIETPWQRKDGTLLCVRLSSTPLDAADASQSVTFTALDITEHQGTLRELESIARFPSENPYPILRIGQDGQILYANPASMPLLADQGAHTGGPAPAGWAALVARALDSACVEEMEVEHRGHTLLLGAVPLPNLGYVNIYGTDITERKRAGQRLIEQELREKHRVEAELAQTQDELVRKTRLAAIGQMSASIAHDLRNPLGAARNAAYLLRRRVPRDEPRLLENIEIIEHEIARADRIITNLLNLTRFRAPNREPVDVGALVRRLLAAMPHAHHVHCQISLPVDPFIIQADPGQISQVLANLLDNAAEAMDGRGELTIEAARQDDGDVLVIRDSGPGWPEEVRERLFEPLVTTKATGTGLGLAICRQIVESHGGTIEAVHEQAPGAAIRIVMPRDEEATQ